MLNKGQTTICEEIEIYSQEKVYTIERLLVDKNIGLVNTEKRYNPTIVFASVITVIYDRWTSSLCGKRWVIPNSYTHG